MAYPEQQAPPRCYVHPDRLAGSVCRRCERPICPACMREAPVGWQCEACVRQGARVSPTTRYRPPDTRIGRRVTPVVAGLIAVNVAVFIWEETRFDNIVSRFAMWPLGIHHGQWYRLITAAFLHANFFHILFNMLTLAIIGSPVEAALGKVRFAALYLVAALGGSVVSYLVSPANQLGVGASGAIFGLMGAYFVLARRRGIRNSGIGGLIVVNLILSFTIAGIDWRAHIGGLVTGSVVTLAMVSLAGRSPERSGPGPVVAGVGVAAGVAVILALLVTLPPGHVNL
jgi:membrane associated rhomboid family serine protease